MGRWVGRGAHQGSPPGAPKHTSCALQAHAMSLLNFLAVFSRTAAQAPLLPPLGVLAPAALLEPIGAVMAAVVAAVVVVVVDCGSSGGGLRSCGGSHGGLVVEG